MADNILSSSGTAKATGVSAAQDWSERRAESYPRLPKKEVCPEELSFVQRFFHGGEGAADMAFLGFPEFEDAVDAYACATTLEEIELFRAAACAGFGKSPAFARLLCLSLDNWIQTLAGTALPHPDMEKYVETVAAQAVRRKAKGPAETPAHDVRADRSPRMEELREYLNAACCCEGMEKLWMNAFPTFFKTARPAFELVFLYHMLCRREYENWRLNPAARRLLCLCGYEYIKRLPLVSFDSATPGTEALIARAVIRTAIEDGIFTLTEQAEAFREALTRLLLVDDYSNLSLLLYPRTNVWRQNISLDKARDEAIRDVMAVCARLVLDDGNSHFPKDMLKASWQKIVKIKREAMRAI